MQCPLISCMQKIVIYETKARYYVVGSNNTETRFRVLKIDRTEPKELHITDDRVEYTQKEIRDLLLMIDVGNRPRQVLQKGSAGLTRTVAAFGIVGFVRFLEGYYIVLITKRRKVALIGPNVIYKIEDTSMIYIPNDTVRYIHPDEQRYVKTFQNVDLSSNFYFSYSYDLTHTLQYNMTPCSSLERAVSGAYESGAAGLKFWRTDSLDPHVHRSARVESDVEDASKTILNFLESMDTDDDSKNHRETVTPETPSLENPVFGVRTKPMYKFVWNSHLLENFENQVHPDWVFYITHGFVGQSNICVFGHPVYLALIARRSNQFAGTRFLKRGANCKGYVANEVETEQIVYSATMTSIQRSHISSFVQLRGSIPLHWSQDISKMVPRPPITVDQADPYGFIAGQHFNQVLRRYGAPVIILNLVKKRENRRHESILSDELVNALKYLNQFLPADHAIQYIGFDMARVSKGKDSNVLTRLAEIAEYCVKKTGFFKSGSNLYCNKLRPDPRTKGMQLHEWQSGWKQHGVVRTNCVDCLDRTNTAQFAMGRCALGFQLYSMGLIDSPQMDFDTDCVRMLEELYEDHGDTLALQYGGSQLVHRIKGYRKIAPWTSSSRDIMQTLSRYYSNAFSDSDKQFALNLFLGVFKPVEGQPNLWELPTDFYLHNINALVGPTPRQRMYCQWWEKEVVRSLPLAYEEESKGEEGLLMALKTHRNDERVDGFWDFYRPYELTSLDEVYSFHLPHSIRDFMPKFSTSYSPFAVRVRPGRRQEESGSTTEANPNVTGKDSTSSVTSTGSEGSTSSSDGSDIEGDIDILGDSEVAHEDSGLSLVSLKALFPTMAQTYGMEIEEPDKHNISLYRRFVQIGTNANQTEEVKDPDRSPRKGTNLVQQSIFPLDSSFSVVPPKVNPQSREIYNTYVRRGQHGAETPLKKNMLVYQKYLSMKYM